MQKFQSLLWKVEREPFTLFPAAPEFLASLVVETR